MSEHEMDALAFEGRLADLLRDYARAADGPIDAFAIADAAAASGQPSSVAASWLGVGGQRWRTMALLLALLGALAALIGSALVLGTPPRALPLTTFSSDELLATVNTREGGVEIVAINVPSGERRVITPDGFVIAISPDRARFLRTDGWDLLVTDAHGNDLARFDSWLASSAVWSPDNRLVLIAGTYGGSQRRPGTPGYSIWDTRSGSTTVLSVAPVTWVNAYGPQSGLIEADRLPEWAPDGAHVLLPTDEGLIAADLEGNVVRLIEGTSRESVGYWSPDGTRILVEDREAKSLVLLAVSSDFETTQVAEVAAGSAREPAWSPDGRSLAFVTGDGVVVAAADRAAAQQVVYRGAVIEGTRLHWAPDGDQLAFVGWVQNGATHWLSKGVRVVDLATGETRVVLSPHRGSDITW